MAMDDTKYDAQRIERKWYGVWQEKGYFKPSLDGSKPSFCIQLPPPNVTGTLHMGHAFNQTIMDGLARYHRMKGDNVLWVPGQDHAGIATQIVVERQMKAQGLDRRDVGREEFVKRVWKWKEESGGVIKDQMKRLGSSCDWDRMYFTMDDNLAQAVAEVFVRLSEMGLIYRNKRLANWDPVLKTAISDLEVVKEDEQGSMWSIFYRFKDDPSKGLTVATTRPETMLGDVAVAVNPEDDRYADMVGKTLILPLVGREIPVIADAAVDAAFGTGCVKITPARDANDYATGKRHGLELINVLDMGAAVLDEMEVYDYDGKLLRKEKTPEPFAGLPRERAREAVVEELKKRGLLVKIEPHELKIPRGDRTGTVIEPMLTDQWFVAMTEKPLNEKGERVGKSLAQLASEAVESGEVRFVPENWAASYNHWFDEIEDWCISRQLWWGHQIPAWYDEDGKVYVARSESEARRKAGGKKLTRDPDVLDTWFSSALVPFTDLGWPKKTVELEQFLPSSVLVTGYEIIFFWVARMVMMTKLFTGKPPFREVYIHGMVKDHQGKKMSKSEGNVIDPVDLIDGIGLDDLLKKRVRGLRRPETAPKVRQETKKFMPDGIPAYGADALRFTMASYASLGRSILFDFKRCEGYRNFCNKIWNAYRMVMMRCEGMAEGPKGEDGMTEEGRRIASKAAAGKLEYSWAEKWVLGRLRRCVLAVTEALDAYRFDLAASALYEFFWNDYCDWYLEIAKIQINTGDPETCDASKRVLVECLETALRLLHPIMPYITEEIWQKVAPMQGMKTADSIMLSAWPQVDGSLSDAASEADMERLKQIVNAVRNLRGEMGLAMSVKAPLVIETREPIDHLLNFIPHLARLSYITKTSALPKDADAPIVVAGDMRLMLDVKVDKEAEQARIAKEIDKISRNLEKLEAKLANAAYVERAPREIVERDQKACAEQKTKLETLRDELKKLSPKA